MFIEASLREPDDDPHGHVSASQAATIAEDARVKKMIMVHIGEKAQKTNFRAIAKKHYHGKLVIGKDLMKVKM